MHHYNPLIASEYLPVASGANKEKKEEVLRRRPHPGPRWELHCWGRERDVGGSALRSARQMKGDQRLDGRYRTHLTVAPGGAARSAHPQPTDFTLVPRAGGAAGR